MPIGPERVPNNHNCLTCLICLPWVLLYLFVFNKHVYGRGSLCWAHCQMLRCGNKWDAPISELEDLLIVQDYAIPPLLAHSPDCSLLWNLCGIFSSVHGLYPLDVSSNLYPKWTQPKLPKGFAKLTLYEMTTNGRHLVITVSFDWSFLWHFFFSFLGFLAVHIPQVAWYSLPEARGHL